MPSPPIPMPDVVIDSTLARLSFGSKPNASVNLLIFGDYECRNTEVDWPMIKALRKDYDGKINIAYRQFPLNTHPHAAAAARAAYCAEEQGKFWEYSDVLFENQANLQDEDLLSYASSLKLDPVAFTDCFRGENSRTAISGDVQFALTHNVRGTPTYFINGKRFEGVQEESLLRNIIDATIQSNGQ